MSIIVVKHLCLLQFIWSQKLRVVSRSHDNTSRSNIAGLCRWLYYFVILNNNDTFDYSEKQFCLIVNWWFTNNNNKYLILIFDFLACYLAGYFDEQVHILIEASSIMRCWLLPGKKSIYCIFMPIAFRDSGGPS
jgi:hypothetical protein